MALRGIRVLELAGLAPVPLVGQILADFGADVLRVNRSRSDFPDPLARGKRSIIVDTATTAGKQLLHRLLEEPSPGCDVLLDPYRPGVLERLLAPQATTSHGGSVHRTPSGLADLLPPRLIVARVSGYSHDPSNAYHAAAGHDINYAAMSGVLAMLRTAEQAASPGSGGDSGVGVSGSGGGVTQSSQEGAPLAYSRPLPPSNLIADFAGGSLTAVNGAYQHHVPQLGQALGLAALICDLLHPSAVNCLAALARLNPRPSIPACTRAPHSCSPSLQLPVCRHPDGAAAPRAQRARAGC
jgi:hypothetical protein